MESINALREKSSHLAKQAKNLLAEKGSSTWTAEEQAQFDTRLVSLCNHNRVFFFSLPRRKYPSFSGIQHEQS